MNNCPKCNSVINNNVDICPVCGNRIGEQVVQPQMGQVMFTDNVNQPITDNYLNTEKSKNFFEFPSEPLQPVKKEKIKMNNNSNMIKIIIIVIACIIVIIGGFLVFNSLSNKKASDNKVKTNITVDEVLSVTNNKSLISYDITSTIAASESLEKAYLIYPSNEKYQIYYTYFSSIDGATNNFKTSLNLIKDNNAGITEIKNESSNTNSKFIGKTDTKYIALVQIGKSYFQIETLLENQKNIEEFISEIE